jgi:hypothetical protein
VIFQYLNIIVNQGVARPCETEFLGQYPCK